MSPGGVDGRGRRFAARIFTAPVPYLNQIEPIFDVLRVTERGFTGMVADHRNILKILVDPELKRPRPPCSTT